MTAAVVVQQARRALGPVGVFLPHSPGTAVSVDDQRSAVQRFERAGYRSAWANELIGKDVLVQLAVLLAATDRLVLGAGIANIWARAPQTAHGAAAQLAQAYPGRLVLGLGVGHPEQAATVGADFGSPLAAMRTYLARMTSANAPDTAYPRIVGANGPKMLALAGEAADGAMPAGVSPEATGTARRILGADKLLVVLVQASSASAAGPAFADNVRAHLAAGADHVVASVGMGGDFEVGVELLEQLAPALTDFS
jgi:probable F420-dependent oxidoreductase